MNQGLASVEAGSFPETLPLRIGGSVYRAFFKAPVVICTNHNKILCDVLSYTIPTIIIAQLLRGLVDVCFHLIVLGVP